MAVYRSDQAQLTFAAEAAQGGDPEMMVGDPVSSSQASASLNGAHAAGSRTLAINSSSNDWVVGDFLRLGTVAGTENQTVHEHEVRRIEFMTSAAGSATNTFTLDRPTAFYHPSGAEVKQLDGIGGDAVLNNKRKFVTFIPGVYETVDTPDPEMSIEGKRFLNTTAKRNWTMAYPGQQTLTGSVSDMLLLNGWPLRFPIGKVTTVPSAVTSSGSGASTLAAEAKKGDVYITLDSVSGFTADSGSTAGVYICIYDAGNTNNLLKKSEVRRVEANPTGDILKLNYPLSFDHPNAAVVRKENSATYYDHEIIETTDLDTVSWHVHMKSSDEDDDKDFDRRYVGGMIGSATITAEEGGMVTMSWDSVNFLNMIHNQQNQATVGTNLYAGQHLAANMPRFGLMQSIANSDIGEPSLTALGGTNEGLPTTQPYYFSQGTLKFFGQSFARVRSFSLSISNGEEPRYYIGQQGKRARGPYEIKEGPREYSMSCSVALPDATMDASAAHDVANNIAGATELFKQLLLEGNYGGGAVNAQNDTGNVGLTMSLRFDRGANDYIIIDVPGGTGAGTPDNLGVGLNGAGIYINTAPHNISTDNPLQVDLDMILRSIKIYVRDQEPCYP